MSILELTLATVLAAASWGFALYGGGRARGHWARWGWLAGALGASCLVGWAVLPETSRSVWLGAQLGLALALAALAPSATPQVPEVGETADDEPPLPGAEEQLDPHFLFNTLHTIGALIPMRPEEAERLLVLLSDVVRMSLSHELDDSVSVERELELCRRYLEIEQIRFADRLSVELNSDPEALQSRIPVRMFQPLVEHAVRHGVALRSAPGTVSLEVERVAQEVRLAVRDDGPGLDGLAGVRRRERLINTRERIESLFGGRGRLRFREPDSGGVEVELWLPVGPAEGERP